MSITRHHNEWLALVPNSGPFVSLLVATQAFPQGLDAHDADHARRLRQAFEEWEEDQSGKRPDPTVHRAWIRFVLRETLGYEQALAEGQAIPQTLRSEAAEHGETLRPDWVLIDPETKKVRLLIQTWPLIQALEKQVEVSRWKASPDTRMTQLLRDTGVRLGLVTNGDHWMLVNAPQNETTGYASWYGNIWLEEPSTLRAFRTLLSAERFFGVTEKETIEALLDRSSSDQQEVTDQLGYQVRKAVEVLIQALDKADQDHGRQLLGDVDEKVLYEAALTVMMRLVFLFCAEERGLLLLGDDLWDRNYAVSTLREQLRVAADQHGEEILGFRHDAWARLLTTFRAVYGGVKHDRVKLPAYGGSLFNPDRFPFLEGRRKGTSWRDAEAAPLPVSNRTVLHLLEALQILQVRLPGGGPAEARKLSFRSLDIEQIGHVYEGLLDHTARRAQEPVLGLKGTRDKEPEIPLSELEGIAASGEDELVARLKDETGRSESALKKALHTDIDAELASRFRTVCQYPEVWERMAPLAGIVREDTAGYPVVITPGSVFVTKGTDRRSTGTHYTPRSLTEPIVQYTLEPLVYVGPAEGLPKEQWKLRPARELLDLKICDMACGSGAFLVQVCRYMAARLLEAWDEVHRANPGTVRITPEGEPSTGQPAEMLIPDDPDERQTYALRIAAQRCLYGVDKNPLAAEMAKLSLWLLTLGKDKPFEFLDHAIRCGDSLVGLQNVDQLRRFSLDGKGETNPLFLGFLDQKIKEAIDLRRRLAVIQANAVEDVEAQERMLREADERIGFLSSAADLLLAAEFVPGLASHKQAAREDAALKVAAAFHEGDLASSHREANKILKGQTPFHWPLEFPEVIVERGGFDAFVGNPPFMGGSKISGAFGAEYRNYLVEQAAGGRRGNADLVAYFFLRAYALLANNRGVFGLLATSTIAQGDTREVALEQLVAERAILVRAIQSAPWPGQAALEIACVWLLRGRWNGHVVLDGKIVQGITSHLTEMLSVSGTPFRLTANAGISFVGTYVHGEGFVLSPDEAEQLLNKSERNREVIFPYLNGEDINSRPDQSPGRWVINFLDWPIEQAQQYPDCFKILRERVLPERQKNPVKQRREIWWRFTRPTFELYKTVGNLNRFLVHPLTSKHNTFVFLGHGIVVSHMTIVVAREDWASYAILQSDLHWSWVIQYGNKLETRPQYTPSDVLETFPFPALGQIDAIGALERAGQVFYESRRRSALLRQEGLTKTYNHFHDKVETSADIEKLRQFHIDMDRAAATAYGWTDLDLGHGFHQTKQGVRFTLSEPARREVLARLLNLNHERHDEEVRLGLHGKRKVKERKRVGKATVSDDTPRLFK